MDPNAQNILLGVTANVLTSLIAASGRVTRRLVSPAGQSREGIEELLGQATGETSDTFNWEGPGPVEEVCLFLSSNEVAAIVRQVFSVRLLGGDEQRHITDIEEEFVASLGFFLGVNNVKDAGAILFAELVRACETTLNRAIERGLLATHEAKSSLRHKLLLEELAVIKQNIAFLTGHQRGTRQTTVEFEAK